jgi:ATP-binding cassette subfamily G (WHITE) protein 2 (SNQ2)
MVFIEVLSHGANHLSILVYKKEDKELKKLNGRLAERRDEYRAGKLEQDLSGLQMKPLPFTWVSAIENCSRW